MTHPGPPVRLLMLGTVNHPHVEHMALGMQEHGLDLVVGGDVEPSLPESILPAAGIEVRRAPEAPRRTLGGLVGHVVWIRRLLRELRPDAVHAHWFPGFAFFATLACASPLVAMAWGSDVYRASARQRLVNRVVARRADLVMTDSADLLERLHELGAPRERGMLINWGVDLTAFSPQPHRRAELRRRLGLGTGPVILSPRSLSPVYNIPTIVEAFARLAGRFPDAQLVLKHMSVAEPDLGELPHPERIKLVGHVAYELMADYYRAADVCVSIASSDSSPRSAWEALACACPLVVSDLPWVHELIEPERHALVVPIDPEPLSAAIERLLNDAQLGERLRVEGRALVEAERDRDAEMARLARAYVELARRPPRRPGRAAIARKVARSSGKARRSNRSRPAR